MASSVREKVVEQIRAAKRAMRDAETMVKTKLVRARDWETLDAIVTGKHKLHLYL